MSDTSISILAPPEGDDVTSAPSPRRVFIIVMVGVSIAWVPVVNQTQGGQVFIYIQEVTNYLAPQVACIFVLGIMWKGCNETVSGAGGAGRIQGPVFHG